MMQRFRDYLVSELELYRKAGIVKANDTKMAADTIVTLMEGLEFHLASQEHLLNTVRNTYLRLLTVSKNLLKPVQ